MILSERKLGLVQVVSAQVGLLINKFVDAVFVHAETLFAIAEVVVLEISMEIGATMVAVRNYSLLLELQEDHLNHMVHPVHCQH